MGNRFLISLLFLSPLLAYGCFLLNKANFGPAVAFRDNWFREREKILNTRSAREDFSPTRPRTLDDSTQKIQFADTLLQPFLLISISGFCVLLILIQASLLSICSLIFTYVIYLWWERSAMEREAKLRRANIEEQLPTIAEVFSILISAGVSPSTAFEWIGERAHGVLGDRIREIVRDCQEGTLLVHALDQSSREISSPLIRRFVDSIAISIDRGSSLAEQLRSYVKEMRSQEQRTLMEKAGKAEIGLMIPVVFLILPISVVFALWPSYQSLNSFFIH